MTLFSMAAAKKLYIEYTQVKIKLSIKQYVLVHGSQFISYQKIVDLAGERAETASEQFLVSPAFQTRVDLLISERMKNAQTDELEAKLDVTQDNTGPGSAADEPWIDP